MNSGLSVGDGFKFGCGFLLASFIAWLVMAIIGGILTAVFGGVISNLLNNWNLLSQIPQLLHLVV
jgi:uncharacterized membrane protein YeiH